MASMYEFDTKQLTTRAILMLDHLRQCYGDFRLNNHNNRIELEDLSNITIETIHELISINYEVNLLEGFLAQVKKLILT